MATFTDRNGREWRVALTVADLPAVRGLCGVGPAEALTTDRVLTGMYGSGPAELTAFVWGLCSGQVQGVGSEGFAAGLDAPALDRLFEAVESEVVSFFNRSAQGESLRRTMPKIRLAIARRAEASILRQLSEDDPPTSSGSPGTSPASSASTPGP